MTSWGKIQGMPVKIAPQNRADPSIACALCRGFWGIFGDSKYGPARERAKTLRLHAWQLSLHHPDTGEVLQLEAPPPKAFLADLSRLDLSLPEIWSPA